MVSEYLQQLYDLRDELRQNHPELPNRGLYQHITDVEIYQAQSLCDHDFKLIDTHTSHTGITYVLECCQKCKKSVIKQAENQ